jgi:hypothetical protein
MIPLPVLEQPPENTVLFVRDFLVLPLEIKPGDDRYHDEENEWCRFIPPEAKYQDKIKGNGNPVNHRDGQEKF